MTVPLVCFDLGGVLVRICRSWEEGCAAAGFPVRAGRDAARLPERLALVHALDTGRIEPAEFYRGIARTMDDAYTPGEIRCIHASWILGEYEGVADLVARLPDLGVETACLSNTNHDHWELMHAGAFPAVQSLRRRLASHILRLRKPDGAIYAAFEQAVGRPPSEIVFFDDLPENVAAARSRGWTAHHVDHTGDTAAQIRAALEGLGLRLD